MNTLTLNFLNLLRAKISLDGNSVRIDALSEDEQKRLFNLAKKHDMAHIVGAALFDAGAVLCDEIREKFKKEQSLVLYRYMQLKNEARSLYATLDDAGITYMVLKGSEIRKHYPSPEMRVSSDIDVLVKDGELERVLKILVDELEYTVGIKTNYDVSTFAPSGVHVEVHYKLTSEDEHYDEALADAWETSLPDGDAENRRVMNPELQLAYTVMHTAKHFHNGGCGVRFIMDLFVLENKLEYDSKKVDAILAKCNLTKFYSEIHRLAQVWFADGEHTELTKNMQDYIIGSGIYGTLDNKVAVFQVEKGGKLRYALSRIFLKKSSLELTYLKLKKYAILYPYYTVIRWFRIIFKRRKEALEELKSNAGTSYAKAEHLRAMLDDLNL